jgi:hypothetical protein
VRMVGERGEGGRGAFDRVLPYLGNDLETISGTTRLRLAWVASGRFAALPVHSQLWTDICELEPLLRSTLYFDIPRPAREAWPLQKLRTSCSFCDRLLRLGTPAFVGLRAVSELTGYDTRLRRWFRGL